MNFSDSHVLVYIGILLVVCVSLIALSWRLNTRLKSSEKDRRRLIETTNEGYWLIEPYDRITLQINQALCDMLGYSEKEMVGRPLFDFAVENEVHIFENETNSIPTADHRSYEITLRRKDGSEIFTQFNATTIWRADGQATGSFAFVTDLTERRALEQELRKQAATDSLTGCLSRRELLNISRRELERCHRYKREASVILLDVDHFKRINDQYGHLTGDDVLRHMVRTIENEIRDNDYLGRLGGEEFGIISTESNVESATFLAERIRKAIMNKSADKEMGLPGISISIGVTAINESDATIEQSMARADEALYAAKREGRNMTRVAG